MLARIWPEVEEEYLSTAVLGREVLRQQKVKLLDSKLRQQQLRKTAEPATQKQVGQSPPGGKKWNESPLVEKNEINLPLVEKM